MVKLVMVLSGSDVQCEYCGKSFFVEAWRFKRSSTHGRFCSIACHNKNRAGQPSWNAGTTMSAEGRAKLSEAHREQGLRNRGVPLSAEHRAKISAYWTGRKRDSSFREKAKRSAIQRIVDGVYRHNDTWCDREIRAILDELGIDYQPQYVLAAAYIVDYLIPSRSLVIEVDGDYWHANPAIYPPEKRNQMQRNKVRRDKAMTTVAKNRGFSMARFWESDIKNDRDGCKQRLISILGLDCQP